MHTHLISSHLISSHLISSHLISSHLISSHLISSHLISGVVNGIHRAPGLLVRPSLFLNDATRKAKKSSALHHAASVGDAAAVCEALRLLEPPCCVDDTFENGVTPLMLACYAGALEPVKMLLAAKADPNRTSKNGCNALTNAAIQAPPDGVNGVPLLVQALLVAGADVNIGRPSEQAQRYMAETGSPCPTKNIGLNCPLLAAATRGHEVYRNLLALLRAGADPNACDGAGMTALHHATRGDNGLLQKALLGDPDFATTEFFDDPSWAGRASLDVNLVDGNGCTPFIYALMNKPKAGLGLPEDAEADVGLGPRQAAFIRAGAQVDQLLPGQLVPTVGWAASDFSYGTHVLRYLVEEACVEINRRGVSREEARSMIQDPERFSLLQDDGYILPGQTPLMIAAGVGNADGLRLLVHAGADVALVDENGFSAYVHASLCGHERVMAQLEDAGATRWELQRDGIPSACRVLNCVGRKVLQQLTRLPESLGQCELLEELILNGCEQLQRLPDSLTQCASLRRLSCTSCRALISLPDGLSRFTRLAILDLSDCISITSLSDALPPALQRLSLAGCRSLSKIPESLTGRSAPDGPTLEALNLSGCSTLVNLPSLVPPNPMTRLVGGERCVWYPLIDNAIDLTGCNALSEASRQKLEEHETHRAAYKAAKMKDNEVAA